MTPCAKCDAFVPLHVRDCPSCGTPRLTLPRFATRAALAAGFVTTLMACYGGPPPQGTVVDPVPESTEGSSAQTPPPTETDESQPGPTSGTPPPPVPNS